MAHKPAIATAYYIIIYIYKMSSLYADIYISLTP